MSSYTRQQLEAWLKEIDVKADRVLDIGGSQNPVKGRTKSWEVEEYKILDLSQPHEIKQAPDIIHDIQELGLDDTQPVELLEYDKHFDVVFCLEVSEYWWNPLHALTNIWFMMKPGATLYISFQFIYPQHEPVEGDLLRYTPIGALRLFHEVGLTVVKHTRRIASPEGNSLLQEFYSLEGMRRSKNRAIDHTIIGSLFEVKKL